MLAVDRANWWRPETADAYAAVLACYLFLIGSLPTAVVAWNEPDVEGKDVEGEDEELING